MRTQLGAAELTGNPEQTVRAECWDRTNIFPLCCSLFEPHARHIFPLAHLAPNCYPKMIYLLWQEERRRGGSHQSLSCSFTLSSLITRATHSYRGEGRERDSRQKEILSVNLIIQKWPLSSHGCNFLESLEGSVGFRFLFEPSLILVSMNLVAGIVHTWSLGPVCRRSGQFLWAWALCWFYSLASVCSPWSWVIPLPVVIHVASLLHTHSFMHTVVSNTFQSWYWDIAP